MDRQAWRLLAAIYKIYLKIPAQAKPPGPPNIGRKWLAAPDPPKNNPTVEPRIKTHVFLKVALGVKINCTIAQHPVGGINSRTFGPGGLGT